MHLILVPVPVPYGIDLQNQNLMDADFSWLHDIPSVYLNTVHIICWLHSESAIISEIVVIPAYFQICGHRTALTPIQLTTKSEA